MTMTKTSKTISDSKKEQYVKFEYYKVNKSVVKTLPKNKQYFKCKGEYQKNKNFSITKYLKSIITSINSINEIKNIIYNVLSGMYDDKSFKNDYPTSNCKILYCWICLDDKLITYDLYCIKNNKEQQKNIKSILSIVEDLGFTIFSRDIYEKPVLPVKKISISKVNYIEKN